ncbi:restriction endonuclease [Thiohalorhabdus methylotrophus]|uniref:Restriction endonuclease n=1 Tax=Thiohalorhabdus methylotrophus TaxID=3242694 RepID=A0ABV4U192_9GAMM
MSDFKEFEDLTAEIFKILIKNPEYEKVEKNVYVQGHDGKREVDVLVTGSIGPVEVVTIVECKDYNKKVTVTEFDALSSKMQDIKAHKAVLVARKGFSNTAQKKAKRLGIDLCTAHAARTYKWPVKLDIPIVIEEVELLGLSMMFGMHLEEGGKFEKNALVNDIDISELFKGKWNNNEIELEDEVDKIEWRPDDIEGSYFKRDINGSKVYLQDFYISAELHRSYYLAGTAKLEGTKELDFVMEGKRTILLNPEDFSGYKEKFPSYSKKSELPDIPYNFIQAKVRPNVHIGKFEYFITDEGGNPFNSRELQVPPDAEEVHLRVKIRPSTGRIIVWGDINKDPIEFSGPQSEGVIPLSGPDITWKNLEYVENVEIYTLGWKDSRGR